MIDVYVYLLRKFRKLILENVLKIILGKYLFVFGKYFFFILLKYESLLIVQLTIM